MLSLDNICPHKQVAKRFLQTCPQDTTKLLGSTNSNFGEYSQDFLLYQNYHIHVFMFVSCSYVLYTQIHKYLN